jgi:hypothetical protein
MLSIIVWIEHFPDRVLVEPISSSSLSLFISLVLSLDTNSTEEEENATEQESETTGKPFEHGWVWNCVQPELHFVGSGECDFEWHDVCHNIVIVFLFEEHVNIVDVN